MGAERPQTLAAVCVEASDQGAGRPTRGRLALRRETGASLLLLLLALLLPAAVPGCCCSPPPSHQTRGEQAGEKAGEGAGGEAPPCSGMRPRAPPLLHHPLHHSHCCGRENISFYFSYSFHSCSFCSLLLLLLVFLPPLQ